MVSRALCWRLCDGRTDQDIIDKLQSDIFCDNELSLPSQNTLQSIGAVGLLSHATTLFLNTHLSVYTTNTSAAAGNIVFEIADQDASLQRLFFQEVLPASAHSGCSLG